MDARAKLGHQLGDVLAAADHPIRREGRVGGEQEPAGDTLHMAIMP
jgi:hypothetical protein